MRTKLKTLLFCVLLFVMPLGTYLVRTETYSFYENRTLARFPALSAQTVFSGAYFRDVETYIGDHFFLRTPMLRLHVQKELALHAPVICSQVLADSVLLPYHQTTQPHYDKEKMTNSLAVLQELNNYCAREGIEFLYVGIPEQSSAYRNAYPAYLNASSYADDSLAVDFMQGLTDLGIDHLDMKDVLLADAERFYSKTDHHFNYYGAYETYLQIVDYVNANVFPLSVPSLQIERVDSDFMGSRNRKLFGLFPSDDALYRHTSEDTIAFERYDNGVQVASEVFHEANNTLYNYYMGGDVAETRITTNRPALPSILVVGDSFTNPLETLLYTSFNEMRSLDFRAYTEKTLLEYLETYKPDIVLLVRDDLSYINTDGNGNPLHTLE